MTSSCSAHGHQRLRENLGLVLGLQHSAFLHVNLPGGVPTRLPMTPQQPVRLESI